jgi:hypothetical protein
MYNFQESNEVSERWSALKQILSVINENEGFWSATYKLQWKHVENMAMRSQGKLLLLHGLT